MQALTREQEHDTQPASSDRLAQLRYELLWERINAEAHTDDRLAQIMIEVDRMASEMLVRA